MAVQRRHTTIYAALIGIAFIMSPTFVEVAQALLFTSELTLRNYKNYASVGNVLYIMRPAEDIYSARFQDLDSLIIPNTNNHQTEVYKRHGPCIACFSEALPIIETRLSL